MKSIKPANADTGRIRRRSSVRKRTASQTAQEANTSSVAPTLQAQRPVLGASVYDAHRVVADTNSTATNQLVIGKPKPIIATQALSSPPSLPPPMQSQATIAIVSSPQGHPPDPPATTNSFQGRKERSSTPVDFIGKPRPRYPPSAHIYDPASGVRLPPTSLAAILSPTTEHPPFKRAYAGDHPPPRPRSRRSTPQPTYQHQRPDTPESHTQNTSISSSAGSTAAASTPVTAAPKRKRTYQRKDTQSQTFIISCRACGQTNVPLLKGGREYFNC